MESAETDKLCLEARRGIAAEALKETEGATRKLAKENAALRKERDRFLNEISDRKVTRVELEEVVRRLEAQRCEASPIRRRDQSSRHFRETTSDAGTSGEKRWPWPELWIGTKEIWGKGTSVPRTEKLPYYHNKTMSWNLCMQEWVPSVRTYNLRDTTLVMLFAHCLHEGVRDEYERLIENQPEITQVAELAIQTLAAKIAAPSGSSARHFWQLKQEAKSVGQF